MMNPSGYRSCVSSSSQIQHAICSTCLAHDGRIEVDLLLMRTPRTGVENRLGVDEIVCRDSVIVTGLLYRERIHAVSSTTLQWAGHQHGDQCVTVFTHVSALTPIVLIVVLCVRPAADADATVAAHRFPKRQ